MVALAGAGTEVLLRVFPGLCPPQQQLKLAENAGFGGFVDDPDLGARPTPLSHETVRTPDYEYQLRLDSLGFPNPQPWPSRPDAAVLGNSLITGPGVGLDGQFTTLLGRRDGLVERSILNLGLPGGAPEQEARIYARYLRALHPKVVVATLWVASDIDNAVQFKHWLAEGSRADFTSYRETFGTTHEGSRAVNAVRDFLSRSYLLRAIFYEVTALTQDDGIPGRFEFSDGRSLFLSVRAQRRLAAGAGRPGFDLAADFIGPLVRLRAAADSDGASLIVVLLPSKEETYAADAFPAVLATVEEVRAGLRAAGLPVLDLYEVFHHEGRSRPLFYKRDIHFNADGNALVAGAIGRWWAGSRLAEKTVRP